MSPVKDHEAPTQEGIDLDLRWSMDFSLETVVAIHAAVCLFHTHPRNLEEGNRLQDQDGGVVQPKDHRTDMGEPEEDRHPVTDHVVELPLVAFSVVPRG
jgi:hypothetical protein